MKNVIITGANGFLGSYVCKSFASSGYNVTAVVRSETSDISAISDIDNIHIAYCELENISKLPELSECNYDLFLHFAWEGSAGSGRCDESLQLKNVMFSCDALRTASKLGCKRFVFAGSIMEYEASQYVLNDCTRPPKPYTYSISKLTADMMLKTLAAELGIEYITAVISNVYGTGEKSMRFLNSTVQKILSGTELNLTSCEQLYDFIYASDAAEAIKLASIKGESFSSFYIGNKDQLPLKNFVLDIKEALHSDVAINFGAVEFNGTYFNYNDVIDTSKLQSLGFHPEINFKDGIKMLAESLKG